MQRSRVFFLAWDCLERNTTLPWRYSSYHTLWQVSSMTHKLNSFVGSKSLNRHRGAKQRASKQVRAAFNIHGRYCNDLGRCDDVHRICPQLCWSLCGKGLLGTFRVRVPVATWRFKMCPLGPRLIKGFCDRAGFFPGAILIISKWYLPGESQTRIALFFTASAMAGAFSGLLAYGIVRMDGVAGYEGWRWVRRLSQIIECNS